MEEIRVYLVEDRGSCKDLSEEEFMSIAEMQGRVYSLKGFQDAYNSGNVSNIVDVIRFIKVKVN